MQHILAIDPAGESGEDGETGISVGSFSDTQPYRLQEYWAIPAGVPEFIKWHKKYGGTFDFVICEDFIQWNSRSDPTPLKVIGCVLTLYPNAILRPAQTRRFVTPEHLKAIGAYVAGGNHRDVTESVRHAIAWLTKVHGHLPTQREVLT